MTAKCKLNTGCEIVCEERLWNYLFYVEWGVQSSQVSPVWPRVRAFPLCRILAVHTYNANARESDSCVSLCVMADVRERREDAETCRVLLVMREWRHGCCCCCCCGGGVVRRQLVLGRMCQPVVLLPLHPPVLEPDLDLSLGKRELMRDLVASNNNFMIRILFI